MLTMEAVVTEAEDSKTRKVTSPSYADEDW
jgi:hypothetical protein